MNDLKLHLLIVYKIKKCSISPVDQIRNRKISVFENHPKVLAFCQLKQTQTVLRNQPYAQIRSLSPMWCICVPVCVYINMCQCVCICVCQCACICVCVNSCVYVCVCTCACVRMCIEDGKRSCSDIYTSKVNLGQQGFD